MEALWNKNIGEKVSIPTLCQFPMQFDEYTVINKVQHTYVQNKFIYTLQSNNNTKTIVTF